MLMRWLFLLIVILLVYYAIPFWLQLFGTFGALLLHVLNYIVWLMITDEGSVPKMRIWSILLIKSDLKWCIHLSISLFIFQLLGEWHCWSTRESLRAHVTKFNGRLRLIRIVYWASPFSVLKLIKIVILWLITPSLLASACFGTC